VPQRSRFQFLVGTLTRDPSNRMVAGVASGVGARLGISAAYVRAGFVVLSLAGLVGVALYLLLWLATPDAGDGTPVITASDPPSRRRSLAITLLFLAAMIALSSIGLWFGAWVWPLSLVIFGIASVLDRGSPDYGSRLVRLTRPPERGGPERPRAIQIGGGIVLMLAGVSLFVASLDRFEIIAPIVIAAAMAAIGFMLVFGPWAWRVTAELAAERRARIRFEERSEMAAHLHDSVLQTLALIQRADDSKKMVTLARAQERELRAWLFGGSPDGNETLRTAIQSAADRVEAGYDVPVEVVLVGDHPIDEATTAIAQAAAEAMANAARHAKVHHVSVFVEATPAAVDVFVSDQGDGFDLATVPHDRRGIGESIRGRMARIGGTATITTAPGEGTEVHLRKEWT
jgi:signal transduction histidine kinase